jgi:glycosyltransferase involved in cell wall biosynthesis
LGKFLRNWVSDNALDPDDLSHPNTYILMPWVPEFPSIWLDNMTYLEFQLLQAKKIFALCGNIWIDRTFELNDDSIQCRVRDNLIHCNMGIAAQNFIVHKTSFNPIGKRQILHISNLYPYKGFDVTCKSLIGVDTILYVASMNEMEIGITKVELDNDEFHFYFIGSINNNDPQVNDWIVENCDFYIHTATMDAQATTILENCARGLIPLITPESGFASPHAIYLTHDPVENRKIIEWALNLPEQELMARSQLLREQIFREHSWESIFGKIWDGIMQTLVTASLNESSRYTLL